MSIDSGCKRVFSLRMDMLDSYIIIKMDINRTSYIVESTEFFVIQYDFVFSDDKIKLCCPIPLDEETIVVVNELSTILVKYVLMENDDLYEFSGSIHPTDYKLGVIKALIELSE